MPLAERSQRSELMDDPSLPPETYAAVLGDLSRVNRWTLAARPTLAFLGRALGSRKTLRVLDVGFGHGDMLRRIAAWAQRRGVVADLVGIDLNPKSAAAALAATPPDFPITYLTGDYRAVGGPFDCIVSSLVAHHMTEPELLAFLDFMEGSTRLGWFVNDLHRHAVAWLVYPLLARAMRVHPIVRSDGTLSVARAFRPAEWHALLEQSGIGDQARVIRRFPYRLCVERLF